MGLCLESGYTSLNKKNEELCGDKVETIVNGDYTTLVLADGLGSGVKANILSTLTSKILCTMVANGIGIEACVETILQSLPVCKVRGVAYATFSVIHMNREGKGYLFEFDNPQAILMRDCKCRDLGRTEMNILGKTVYRSDLALKEGDVLIVMSDGVIHAGIGMTLNFGWQRPEVMEFLDRVAEPDMTAPCIACLLAGACNDLYMDQPGDDTTVAAVRVREECRVSIMVGPPVDQSQDNFYIARFLKKVVASFDYPDEDVPPIGYIEGIDLTTEGVLTLRKLLQYSERYLSPRDLSPKYYRQKDGASLLADYLFVKATSVTFFVGQSINKAHQGLPIDTTMKLKLVETLSENLRKMGKIVEVNYD